MNWKRPVALDVRARAFGSRPLSIRAWLNR
jgi:hypothetical protein